MDPTQHTAATAANIRQLEQAIEDMKTEHAAHIKNLQTDAQNRLDQQRAALTGKSTAYLDNLAANHDADEAEGAKLRLIFGKTSSAKEANALAMRSPETYKQLKRRAQQLGII